MDSLEIFREKQQEFKQREEQDRKDRRHREEEHRAQAASHNSEAWWAAIDQRIEQWLNHERTSWVPRLVFCRRCRRGRGIGGRTTGLARSPSLRRQSACLPRCFVVP
jgi:hypothetical protein